MTISSPMRVKLRAEVGHRRQAGGPGLAAGPCRVETQNVEARELKAEDTRCLGDDGPREVRQIGVLDRSRGLDAGVESRGDERERGATPGRTVVATALHLAVSEKSSTVPPLVGLAAAAFSMYTRVFSLGR